MIRRVGASYLHITRAMSTLLFHLFDRLGRFERWFELRYGWFFTNGMKDRAQQR